MLISHTIDIRIDEGEKDPILPLCRKADRRTSWTKTSPRGFWSHGKNKWNSLICQEATINLDWIKKCLQSTTVWMIGDSNIRFMAIPLSVLLGCNESQLNQWPAASLCRNEYHNITIRFRPHEYPLYVASRWLKLLDNGAVTDTLHSIPSTGSHIVIIHYFLHFSSSHLSVLEQRLTVLKAAISKLISRNPGVLVIVRGPHTSTLEWEKNHMFAGDVLGTFIRQIYFNTFRDMQDRVVFLDGWDMSISYENPYFHPSKPFLDAMWQTILSYKCD